MALVQSVNDSRRAWRNFFDSATGKRKGRRVGRPRMKSRKDHRQSFRLTRNGFSVCGPVGGCLWRRLARSGCAGRASCPRSRRSVTIIGEPDGHYYASFVVDVAATPLPAGGARGRGGCGHNAVGDDRRPATARAPTWRTRSIWVASCASCGGWSGRSPAGRRDRTTGTRRGAKSAIAHNKVARARRDYHHKQALALVRENQVIHVEDLNIVGMVKNRRLARAISDAGWGQFVRIIGEKADRYGRTLHQVSRWLASSKTCSACGHRLDELPLQVRQWTCPTCWVVHDRDHNAAKSHSRRRAGGETKRLWSPCKTATRCGGGR